jgi:hypothetical protein
MPDEISAATHQIGQAMFLSAVMNAAPFQADPKVFAAVVFGSSVVAGAHAVLSLVGLDKPEAQRRELLVLIHNDLMFAMKAVLMKHAPSGFSMLIRDGTVPPASTKPPRFEA